MYWIWSLLDLDESLLVTWVSPPIFGLQHYCRFRKRMQLNVGGLRLNTLFLYFLFHHLYLYFFFFFLNFPSFCSLYLFFFCSIFFYFLLQCMLILLGLSWCHKFQLHFMSLMPQIKGTFIKIDRVPPLVHGPQPNLVAAYLMKHPITAHIALCHRRSQSPVHGPQQNPAAAYSKPCGRLLQTLWPLTPNPVAAYLTKVMRACMHYPNTHPRARPPAKPCGRLLQNLVMSAYTRYPNTLPRARPSATTIPMLQIPLH